MFHEIIIKLDKIDKFPISVSKYTTNKMSFVQFSRLQLPLNNTLD